MRPPARRAVRSDGGVGFASSTVKLGREVRVFRQEEKSSPQESAPTICDGEGVRLLKGVPVHGPCHVLLTFMEPASRGTCHRAASCAPSAHGKRIVPSTLLCMTFTSCGGAKWFGNTSPRSAPKSWEFLSSRSRSSGAAERSARFTSPRLETGRDGGEHAARLTFLDGQKAVHGFDGGLEFGAPTNSW